MPSPSDLNERLTSAGQEELLRFWDELSAEQQAEFAGQIDAVDFDLIAELYRSAVGEGGEKIDWAELARKATPPPAMRLAERESGAAGGLGVTPEQAKAAGEAALAAGEVGVLLVAGGQGSRLGFDKPKGMYPIGPVSSASLLQIHLEKAVALGKRYGAGMPMYVMTSPITHEPQKAFLAEHDRFGLAEDDLILFSQGTMPAVDRETGKLLLADKDKLFLSPDGHGGAVAGLANKREGGESALEHMRRRGVKHLFYLQVDNPLVPVGDAEFIGYHLLAESELTSMAVAKQEPKDKLGNFALIDGAMNVIEYSDMPDDVAEQTDDDAGGTGGLRFWAGSIAVHVFDVPFLERMLAHKDGLPFHIANKKVPHLNDAGELVKPTEPNALKFERFIFDLLPKAKNPIVVEYAERDVFAPLKNAPGAPKDTEEYVQRFLVDQHTRWLTAAGVDVPDGASVEISPLWGLDAAGVAEAAGEGVTIAGPVYLR